MLPNAQTIQLACPNVRLQPAKYDVDDTRLENQRVALEDVR